MKRTGGLRNRVGVLCTAIVLAVLIPSWIVSDLVIGARSPVRQAAAANPAPSPSATETDPEDAVWQKRWWIDKTARLLRGGAGIGPEDDLEALMRLPEDQIVRRFMEDPRFGDTILDFNMYFLGFKTDSLKVDGHYARTAFDFSNVVNAAQALLAGGDYLTLFDLEGPYFMPPLRSTPLEDPPARADAGLSPQQLRRKAVAEGQAMFAELMEFLTSKPAPSGYNACVMVLGVAAQNPALTQRILRAFDDAEVFFLTRSKAIAGPLDAYEKAAQDECLAKPGPQVSVQKLAAAVQAAADQYGRTFAEISKFEPSAYRPRSVRDFRSFDLSALPDHHKWLAFGFEQGVALSNSSTNSNRRRAAYVLKRYFCDDLTPVGVETPQQHVGGAHGSDTTCYACHYKLDPMAGFFRSYGAYFFDFSGAPIIAFDDLTITDRNRYVAAWQAPAGAPRQWNVGYIRSPRWEAGNIYGESLADLSRLIREAPEAKRCLMKRLVEYTVAENQTIDGGYLDYLTSAFEKDAAVNASTAMKNAIARIVESRVFLERNADPQRCYDRAPGAQPDQAPPCRVAFILEKNCGQCHNPTYGAVSRLDLASWIPAPNGVGRTFPHLDKESRQLSPQETLSRIVERLSTNDPHLRMPKNRPMESQERQELFLWAQDELARRSRRASP